MISPLPPPPKYGSVTFIQSCSKSPFFSFYTLLATTVPLEKKYKIAPKSDKNNGNFLRATLITLRASSYSPLNDIKNQDDLIRQGN